MRLLVFLVVVAVAWWPARCEAADRPNVVVILADDLGYGDLACCGADDMRTPHVDRLFAQGIRFGQSYANCPVCSPTRAALLTGRYPELVGVPGVIRTQARDNWGYLRPDAVLLPKLLKAGGYRTAIIGKWHLGLKSPNRPGDRGFDHFHGYLGDMMDDYYNHRRHGINYMRRGDREIDPPGHATDLFTDWACDWLRRQSADQPFFLYLAYNAPHTPIQPPQDWLKKVRARETDVDPRRARLIALIEHMDDGIGRVMQVLKNTGLADNTLVIFTSDNGGQLNVGANNGPLRDGKQSMYEGGIKVPMAAVWPGKIAPGTSSAETVISMDLFPTICQVAGVEIKHDIDGRSILPALLGSDRPQPERTLFWTRREGGRRYMGKTIHAVRRGDWKLVHDSPFATVELFHLQDDPLETTDLAGSQRAVYDELSAALRAHIQRGGAVPWQAPRPPGPQ